MFVFQVRTYTRSINFQSKSESLTTENVLPFTDEVIVVLEHKCLQQLHFLALHVEILGYIPGLLNGLIYLRKIGDLSGDNLILRLLRNILELEAPCRLTVDAENKLRGVTLTVGNKF